MSPQPGQERGLARLQANDAGLPEGRDPEYLRQIQVTLRRARSAFIVFDAVIPGAAVAPTVPKFKSAQRSDSGGKRAICLM